MTKFYKLLVSLGVIATIVLCVVLWKSSVNYPILLVNAEYVVIKETTEGARARIKELEEGGKTIYEIVDILEEEGYILESEK